MAGHPADQRGDHRRVGQGLDPVLPRPAAADEPVEQRGALGAAHAPLPAHRRVPVAGGAHLPRHRAGGRRRGRHRPRGLPRTWPRTGWRSPSSAARKSPAETFPGADLHARHRGDDARPQARSRRAPATCSARTSRRRPASSSWTATTSASTPTARRWGFSTRMVGATIMAHGDDSGLVLPPNVAPAAAGDRAHLPHRGGAQRCGRRHRGARGRRSRTSRPRPARCAARSTGARSRPASSTTTGSCAACPSASRSVRATWPPARACSCAASTATRRPLPLDALAAELPERLARLPAGRSSSARSTSAPANTHRVDTLRRLQGRPGRGGRLPAGALVRRRRPASSRSATRPGATIRVIPFDLARGAWRMPRRRPALDAPGALRPRLLSGGSAPIGRAGTPRRADRP